MSRLISPREGSRLPLPPVDPKPGAPAHALGPIVYRLSARRPVAARLIAGIVLVGCVGILSASAYLMPEQSGIGTHQQLGSAPCSRLMLTGYPCPTCGMTTAFAHAVRGELFYAFHAQPAGLALALLTMLIVLVSTSVVITGKVLAVNWYRVSPAKVTLVAAAVILTGWLYKLVVGLMMGTLPVGR